MTFQPTEEQSSIVAAARTGANLMVTAMAGCAKTTTLKLIARGLPTRPSLALAFNVKIKKELESGFPSHFDVKTLNGLGHQAWNKATGKRCSVDEKKLGNIVKEVFNQEKLKDSTSDEFVGIIQLVRRAKVMGMVPDGCEVEGLLPDCDDSWEQIGDSIYTDLSEMQIYLARQVLRESIRLAYAGVIDFDDQIYMSALFGGMFPKYPVVMVDESQDLSALNHIQLAKCALSQLIVVGDPRQAIYAFRGADSSSMDTLRQLRETWIDLPLSTTFRCPRLVVERQQSHAPGFNAAPANPDGEVKQLPNWKDILSQVNGRKLAILCRNNAPLIKTAMRLIRSGHGCTILGREIEKGLVKLLKEKCKDDDDSISAIQKIYDWSQTETAKARANGKEERVALITDKAECLTSILGFDDVKDVKTAAKAIEKMFSSDNLYITLATGHKAKGLEWPVVLHLDPWRIPSKFARRAMEAGNTVPMEQDLNLRYVIETRTQHTLAMASLEEEEVQMEAAQ
jgi:DNA helicase-2/ATP-dependent DNA helicase PcrA